MKRPLAMDLRSHLRVTVGDVDRHLLDWERAFRTSWAVQGGYNCMGAVLTQCGMQNEDVLPYGGGQLSCHAKTLRRPCA